MSPAHRTVHIVPHTHWDREWYQPFQVFRARLVDVVDEVLELLENDPEYRRFTLDGQAVVLDDYLEVRPERAATIAEHVRTERLRIGPWYVLADEFLVSPEALVRNLELGRDTCRRYGEPMRVAYTPDSFGHVSQLPLIVKGFGLDAIIFERGVGNEGERLRAEFNWIAADGVERVLAVHLLNTYSAVAALGHLDWELRDDYDPERARRHFSAALYGSEALGEEFPEWLRQALERLEGGLDAYATGDAVLMLNGSDHLFPQPNLPAIVRDLDSAFEHVDVVHSDVEEYVRAVQSQDASLATHRGEFTGSRYHHVLSGVWSARMYLKQANHHAQTLLERYAEPLTALAARHGAPDQQALLRIAWRTLLLNHAHDSIYGCSIDPVHREVMSRFEQVTQLGEDLCRRAVDHLADHRDDPRDERLEARHLALYNPLPTPLLSVVDTELRLPPGSAARLRVLDAGGRPLLHQTVSRAGTLPGRADEACEEVQLTVLADVPPLGITSVRVETEEGNDEEGAAERPGQPGTERAPDHAQELGVEPVIARASAHDEGVTLENEHLRVEIGARGNVTLIDKGDGHARDLKLRFEDIGDAGDEYDFSGVGDPLTFDTSAAPPRLLERGPVRASARLHYRLELPQRLSSDRQRREGRSRLPIELTVALEVGVTRLDLRVDLENQSEDHRLRLVVSSGCDAELVAADGHFHVLQRDLRPHQTDDWYQQPSGTRHQRRFVAVTDTATRRGLALLNRGLPEYQAEATDAGVELAVTLLRCVGWLSRDDLRSRPQGAGPALPTPEAQCRGRHTFDLALVPFFGDWWQGPLPQEAERFTAPPRAFAVGAPIEVAGLRVDPPLTLSAYRPSRDGSSSVLRLWNPAPVPVNGRLTFDHPLHEVHLVRLDETREARLEPTGAGLDLALGPAQVISLELVPSRREGRS